MRLQGINNKETEANCLRFTYIHTYRFYWYMVARLDTHINTHKILGLQIKHIYFRQAGELYDHHLNVIISLSLILKFDS